MKTILIIDDDEADRMAFRRLVRQQGLPYQLLEAASLSEGLAWVNGEKIDLALVDHRLPDGDGLEFLSRAPECPSIFVTANQDILLAVEAMKQGAYDFVVKDDGYQYLQVIPTLIGKTLKEAQSRQLLSRQQKIINDLDEGVVLLNENRHIMYANPAAGTLLNWNVNALVGKAWREVTGEVGPGESYETCFLRSDGSECWVNWRESRHTRGEVICTGSDITEKKRSFTLLEERVAQRTAELADEVKRRARSETRFRALYESFSAGIILYDGDGRVVLANPIACEILDIPVETVVGTSLFSGRWKIVMDDGTAILPDQHPLMAEVIYGRPLLNQVIQIVSEDGEYHWLLINAVPMGNEAEHINGVIVTFVDISELKQAEEALRQSEERYRILFDQMLDGFALIKLTIREKQPIELKVVEVNQGMAVNTGKPVEFWKDLTLDDFRELVTPERMLKVGEVLRGGPPHREEIHSNLFQGVFDVSYFSPSRDMLAIMVRNVTERTKMAAEERRQRAVAEALADTAAALNSTLEFEEVLERILNSISRVVPHDAATICLVENGMARVVRHHGYEAVGLTDVIQNLTFVVDKFPNLKKMSLAKAPVCTPNVDESSDWVRQDSSRWVKSYIGAPILIRDELVGLINIDSGTPGFFTKEAAEALQAFADQAATAIYNARLYHDLRQELEERERLQAAILATQKMVDLGTMAAGVAHEMNSPLQVLTGLSDGLLAEMENRHALDPVRLHRSLELISRNAWRMADIVRALRDYSQAATQHLEALSLNDLAHDALLLMESQLKQWAGITVTQDLDKNLPAILGDRSRLVQVVTHLLTNARDAIEALPPSMVRPLGGHIKISTRFQTEDRRCILVVEDNGIGITAEQEQRIFAPFFTTKPVGKGVGLGLAVSRGIIQAHGGDILCETVPGEGTRFILSFPQNARIVVSSEVTASGRYEAAP